MGSTELLSEGEWGKAGRKQEMFPFNKSHCEGNTKGTHKQNSLMEKTFSSSLVILQCSSSSAPMGWKRYRGGVQHTLSELQCSEPTELRVSSKESLCALIQSGLQCSFLSCKDGDKVYFLAQ